MADVQVEVRASQDGKLYEIVAVGLIPTGASSALLSESKPLPSEFRIALNKYVADFEPSNATWNYTSAGGTTYQVRFVS